MSSEKNIFTILGYYTENTAAFFYPNYFYGHRAFNKAGVQNSTDVNNGE